MDQAVFDGESAASSSEQISKQDAQTAVVPRRNHAQLAVTLILLLLILLAFAPASLCLGAAVYVER